MSAKKEQPMYRMNNRRQRVSFACTGESRTKQSFSDECDINSIMSRFEKTGLIDHVKEHSGNYGDFHNLPTSYHDACNQVIAAEEMFMTIPARVRAKFNNDPGQFLDFVRDPDNEADLVELGLANSREPLTAPPEPTEPPKAPEPTTPPKEGAT